MFPYCGEIVIMEHVNSNDYTNAVIKYMDTIDVTEYHVYAIELTEEQILFLVDMMYFGFLVYQKPILKKETLLENRIT